MLIHFGDPVRSSSAVEQGKPAGGAVNEAADSRERPFAEVLAQETAKQAVESRNVPQSPPPGEAKGSVSCSKPYPYGFARGPGYGSGLGTAGYGSDAAHEPDDLCGSLKSENKSPGGTSCSTSPLYGSGLGTAGAGSDAAPGPDDLCGHVRDHAEDKTRESPLSKGAAERSVPAPSRLSNTASPTPRSLLGTPTPAPFTAGGLGALEATPSKEQ